MSGTTFELKNKVVRAGAGAGKTTNLTESVISIADSFYEVHGRLPNMVVTTFTRKATEELRERVTSELFKQDKAKLFGLVQSKQHLQISTIHGVLSLFLRQYGQLVGLEAGFTVTDDDASYRMAKNILHEIIQNFPNALELMESFSFEQLLRILLQRRRNLIEQPELKAVSAKELSDYSKKYKQLKLEGFDRVLSAIVSESSNDKWSIYANAFRSNLEKVYEGAKPDELGRKPAFSKKNPPFSESLNSDFEHFKKEFDSLSKKTGLDKSNYSTYEKLSSYIDQLGQSFDKKLREEKYKLGLLDSSDLELFSIEILREEPELGRAFAQSWDYWLVDEYQDTSPVQVEIMSKLRGDRKAYMVGDPQQSIYLFRGARVEVFEQEEKRLLGEGGESFLLSKNYRSRPELLKAINDIVHNLGEGFSPMEPREESYEPRTEVLHLLRTSKEDEEPYQGIVNYIIDKLESGAKLDDFCVLAKANSTLVKVSRALEACGISCSVHAAAGYFSRREVIDMMSLLKFLVNPHDNLNLIRLLKSPWFRLPDEKLVQICSQKKASHWLSMSELLAEEPVYQRLLESLQSSDQLGYIEAFRRLVFESGLVDLSHWHDPTGRRESNIWKLITDLRKQERLSGFNPVEVFRRFERALSKIDDESDAVASKEPNRVNLMTVHKSKGLKFKFVILPNTEKPFRTSKSRGHDSLFVSLEEDKRWSPLVALGEKNELKHSAAALLELDKLSQRELQESKRLLYVAVTRAQEGLCLHAVGDNYADDSWAKLISFWGLEPGVHLKDHYSLKLESSEFEKKQRPVSDKSKSLKVREAFESVSESSTKKRFSVTSLVEGLSQAQASHAPQSFEQIEKSIKAPSLGSILHNVFERMRYQLGFDEVTYLSDKLGSEAEKFIESIDYVTSLTEPPMRQIIETGNVEWGFQVKTKEGILEGQIDIWAKLNDVVWVIDYKSGSVKHSDKAFQQLEYYAWALQKAFGYQNFKLAVIYPLSAEVKIQTPKSLEHLSL